MPNTGTDFGSDLWDLMKVARGQLPNMAAAFSKAAAHVEETADGDGAFDMRIRASFQELRNEYHRLLIESQNNLQDSSTVLVQVINDYAATDNGAEQQLRHLVKEYNDEHEKDIPATKPGQPYEVPKYKERDPMTDVDRQTPHYPGEHAGQ